MALGAGTDPATLAEWNKYLTYVNSLNGAGLLNFKDQLILWFIYQCNQATSLTAGAANSIQTGCNAALASMGVAATAVTGEAAGTASGSSRTF